MLTILAICSMLPSRIESGIVLIDKPFQETGGRTEGKFSFSPTPQNPIPSKTLAFAETDSRPIEASFQIAAFRRDSKGKLVPVTGVHKLLLKLENPRGKVVHEWSTGQASGGTKYVPKSSEASQWIAAIPAIPGRWSAWKLKISVVAPPAVRCDVDMKITFGMAFLELASQAQIYPENSPSKTATVMFPFRAPGAYLVEASAEAPGGRGQPLACRLSIKSPKGNTVYDRSSTVPNVAFLAVDEPAVSPVKPASASVSLESDIRPARTKLRIRAFPTDRALGWK